MKAGIIAEGKSDLAVLTNILKGILEIDKSDVIYLVPELQFDETDLANMSPGMFSNWTIVKKHCEERRIIGEFFDTGIDDGRFLIIHIDSEERFETHFEVNAPPKERVNNNL